MLRETGVQHLGRGTGAFVRGHAHPGRRRGIDQREAAPIRWGAVVHPMQRRALRPVQRAQLGAEGVGFGLVAQQGRAMAQGQQGQRWRRRPTLRLQPLQRPGGHDHRHHRARAVADEQHLIPSAGTQLSGQMVGEMIEAGFQIRCLASALFSQASQTAHQPSHVGAPFSHGAEPRQRRQPQRHQRHRPTEVIGRRQPKRRRQQPEQQQPQQHDHGARQRNGHEHRPRCFHGTPHHAVAPHGSRGKQRALEQCPAATRPVVPHHVVPAQELVAGADGLGRAIGAALHLPPGDVFAGFAAPAHLQGVAAGLGLLRGFGAVKLVVVRWPLRIESAEVQRQAATDRMRGSAHAKPFSGWSVDASPWPASDRRWVVRACWRGGSDPSERRPSCG